MKKVLIFAAPAVSYLMAYGIRYHRGRRTGAVSSGYDHAAFYSKMHIFCTARSPAEPFQQTYRC